MNLLERIRGRLLGESSRDFGSVDDYISLYNQFFYNGFGHLFTGGAVQQSLGGETTEPPSSTFVGLATNAYAASGPVFACEMVRMLVFSSVRFMWQNIIDGKPSDLWADDPSLRLLQRPWSGGTTQDLLVAMILDADLAGNAYIMRNGDELVRLRPDWVHIVLEPRAVYGGPGAVGGGQIGYRRVGYIYQEGGVNSGESEPVFLDVDEVAHFAPVPDPLASYRGMSWLTPVLREVWADHAMTRHQRKFFDQGATPNMIVKYQPGMTLEKIKAFKELLEERHTGVDNAYKTLHLAPGADPVPVGATLRQVDFKEVRGAGETRIAAAAGVPPVIAGFSEGLANATYSNFGQARRKFADATMHPLWENAAGSLEVIMPKPRRRGMHRLWYDATGVPFLREDEKDAAEIAQIEAETINKLITAGYTPESVVKAVTAQDWRLLEHTGLTSVQLMEPGSQPGTGKQDDDEPQRNRALAPTNGRIVR